MNVTDTRALIRMLGPIAAEALEAAAGRCVAAGHREVAPEHLLVQALAIDRSDAATILDATQVDRSAVRDALEVALTRIRPAENARPVWSVRLLQTLEEAALLGSVELGEPGIRTGTILLAMLRRPDQLPEAVARALRGVEDRKIAARFVELVAGSVESSGRTVVTSGTEVGKSGDRRLDPYTRDLREAARRGEIDPVFGRERELEQLAVALCRRRKNNPMLVGEPGVGKTAIVEALALAIEQGEVPEELRDVDLLLLDLASLRAGASMKGELERRLKGVIDAVEGADRPIILFVDEAHTLLGAKGGQGGDETADLLKPALARGRMRVIGATTWREYKRDIEKDPALERRFEIVAVEEPDEAQTLSILRGLREAYELRHGIPILDRSLTAAVSLSTRHLTGRCQPDKAIDLLDGAAAFARLRRSAAPLELQRLEGRHRDILRECEALRREEARGHDSHTDRITELDRELDRIGEQLETQRADWLRRKSIMERIDAIRDDPDAGEALAELRAEAERIDGGRSACEAVDDVAVADMVARRTGIPVGRLLEDRASLAETLEEQLRGTVLGQDHAVATAARSVRNALAGLAPLDAPAAVLLCVGPSGVGKTQLARSLAELAFGGERSLITVNMGEYQERHTVSRLIGSPPGYVGYGEGGQLTEAVRKRPHSLVLLDEVEKAHRDVLGVFYEVFDRGRLADGEGRVVDLRNTIVMLTSNLASDVIVAACEGGRRPSPDQLEELLRPHLERHFLPALLGRMTVIPFLPLRDEAIVGIVDSRIRRLADRMLAAHGAALEVAPEAKTWLAALGTGSAGVRGIDAAIRRHLMPPIADAVLASVGGDVVIDRVLVTIADERPVVSIRHRGGIEGLVQEGSCTS
jgi:type VI secretion system protein VasG